MSLVNPRVATAVGCLLLTLGVGVGAQETPLLWRDPGGIGERDLRWSTDGSPERQPVGPFTFVKEDMSGSKPKVRVTDANGVTWNVKFPGPERGKNEVHPELAANRIAAALGYFTEEDYYVPHGRIHGVRDLKRANSAIGRDGTFRVARFERRDANVERTGAHWTVESNPFVGTQELSGLKILLALVTNWDNKPENSGVERVTLPDGSIELRYLLTDCGAAFGRMSGPPRWTPAPTRWHIEHYRTEPLTRGVVDGALKLHYRGQVPIDSVPLEHAKWFADLASQLRPEQVKVAFEAAGASAAEADAFATRLIEKIQELTSAVGSTH
jgi:hypothetical protein